ncbi:hypothetical protein ANN_07507 [Periplaneta americana]|uniref:Uncharacterized protein n=1 Tax=Periplaneta americana TaxID=6978 RepID=A0ABQ8T0C1_PERAM|nr:hypothetical protein ANN_07507 [Periplaneta americana]
MAGLCEGGNEPSGSLKAICKSPGVSSLGIWEATQFKMITRIDDDNNFLNKVAFSNESTFHVCGKVNTHNVRIWGSTNPHMVREVIRGIPKVNVWCCVMVDRIIGPFIFAEQKVNATSYKDMLELFAIPQLFELQPTVFVQQDGAPLHWALEVRRTLDNTFPARWIGRRRPIAWPPRSPDLTPLELFLWGFVKDKVYRTRVIDLDDLKARIRAAIASVDIDMLRRVWTELEFRLDVVRATRVRSDWTFAAAAAAISDLGWGEHVTDTAGKAWRALHFVMRVLRKGSDKSKEIACKSLVRPVMEYGAACWDPYRLEHIKTLEKIQKRALKCCRKNSPLKWDTLTDRRTRIRLCALFKTYRDKVWLQQDGAPPHFGSTEGNEYFDRSELQKFQLNKNASKKILTMFCCNSTEGNKYFDRSELQKFQLNKNASKKILTMFCCNSTEGNKYFDRSELQKFQLNKNASKKILTMFCCNSTEGNKYFDRSELQKFQLNKNASKKILTMFCCNSTEGNNTEGNKWFDRSELQIFQLNRNASKKILIMFCCNSTEGNKWFDQSELQRFQLNKNASKKFLTMFCCNSTEGNKWFDRSELQIFQLNKNAPKKILIMFCCNSTEGNKWFDRSELQRFQLNKNASKKILLIVFCFLSSCSFHFPSVSELFLI